MAIVPIGVAKIVPAVGQALGIQGAIQLARPAICSLYKSDPGWYTRSPSILGRDVGRVASLYLDDLCSDQPLPPPPTLPHVGGQCPGVSYVVTFRRSNPSTGVNSDFTRTLTGPIGAVYSENAPGDTSPDPLLNWRIRTGATPSNPGGVIGDLSNGTASQFAISIVNIARVGGGLDNCGNPFPVDPPSRSPVNINTTINLPDIRISPSATVVIPVVLVKPTLQVNPSLNVDFNFPINIGGVEVNFNGSEFSFSNDIDVDLSTVTTAITNSQTNINANTNTSITNAQTNINASTNTSITNARTNINANTNTSITNSQTNINANTNSQFSSAITTINNNTNTSVTNAQTNINNNTNTAIVNLRGDINASINASANLILAQIQALANLTAIINADMKLALEFLLRIEAKPDCPEPVLPPGNPDVDDIVKPEEPKTGSNPKIQAVTIVLTQNPRKAQWGGGNGAPDKQIAGWFAWKVEGYGYSPQMAINYQTSTFIRPPNVGGYAYTLTNGARGFAIEHTLK